MADVETKVEETVEATATEEKVEKTETKKGVDVNKVMDTAKTGVATANKKLTDFFTGNGKRSKLVLVLIMVLEALLAFNAGFINFILCLVLTVVGFIGLNAAVPTEEKENKEDKAE